MKANLGRFLFRADAFQSVLDADGASKLGCYTPFGFPPNVKGGETGLAYNGQLLPVSGAYLLGHGYRAYNPMLMRFHSPDSWSPLGAGGLNCYCYCNGDPVNAADPTGHRRVLLLNDLILTNGGNTARWVRRVGPEFVGRRDRVTLLTGRTASQHQEVGLLTQRAERNIPYRARAERIAAARRVAQAERAALAERNLGRELLERTEQFISGPSPHGVTTPIGPRTSVQQALYQVGLYAALESVATGAIPSRGLARAQSGLAEIWQTPFAEVTDARRLAMREAVNSYVDHVRDSAARIRGGLR